MAQVEVEAMRSQSDKERIEQILRERKFGEYEILDELGRGGMGIVYKAFHRRMKRIVALKLILPEVSHKDSVLKRFHREAEMHARLRHPNIVNVYDFGEFHGLHFIAMAFITGTALTELIEAPEMTLDRRVRTVQQIASALGHAHDLGVLHRDIKPDNIIVDAGWAAQLVDFGVSKPMDMTDREAITRHGLAIGTPHYMAPEQFQRALGEAGPRGDIYSLGAVLYHVISGNPPFDAPTGHEVLVKVATSEPTPLEGQQCPTGEAIPADLAAIVQKAMQKDPDNRYQHGKDFAADLQRFRGRREVQARPLSKKQRLMRTFAQHRGIIRLSIMVLGLMLVTIAAFVAVSTVGASHRKTTKENLQNLERSVESAHRSQQRVTMHKALEETQKEVQQILSSMDEHSRKVSLVYAIAGGISTFLTIMFGFFVIIRRMRNETSNQGEPPLIAPSEIGATADALRWDESQSL